MNIPSIATAALLAATPLLPTSWAQGTTLGPNGFIQTTTDVSPHADLALDLRDMSERLVVQDFDAIWAIFSSGKNSALFGSDGKEIQNKRPLRWGNTNAKTVFQRDMTYLFQVYGLARGNPDDVTDDVLLYSDRFVDDLIGERSSLVVEGARALNMWMFAVHRVWDALRACSGSAASFSGEAPKEWEAQEEAGSGAAAKLDEAMAYWIGSGFDDEKDPRGYSLFDLAQDGAALFGTDGAAGDVSLGEGGKLADANFKIKALYDQAKVLLGTEGACGSFDGSSVGQLYMIVNDMVAQMSVPLVQSLIAAMYDKNPLRARLYATAIVPQLSACRASAHAFLQDSLMDNDHDPAKFVKLLAALQSTYECLGISCADVGTYMKGKVPQCADAPGALPLAGYTPTTPVREHSKMDLDILQIKLLTKLGTYDLAGVVYARGRNSRKGDDSAKYRKLKTMATSKDRNLVDPFYDEFEMYFDDKDYADTMIEAALNGVGKWGKASASQRSEMIVKTLQYQVMYMYALTQLHESLEACLSEDSTRSDQMVHNFDEAVAYMTGSLEGHAEGGSYQTKDGMLMYGLANRRCEQFGQCKAGGPARILGVYQDLYYAAKGAMASANCNALKQTVHKIEHVIMVPVIQSVIRYAIKNERLPADSPSKDLAEGEMFALAVLPIVDLYEDDSADVLERNMIMEKGRKPVVDGDQAVANALYQIMDEFGIPCEFIGTTEGVTPCIDDEGYTSRNGGFGISSPNIISLSLLATLMMMWA